MKSIRQQSSPQSLAANRIAIRGLTLIALGLSVLFLNSWDNLFVRVSVGFFWGAFLLIVNRGGVIQAFQFFKHEHDRDRRSTESITTGRQRAWGNWT